MTPESVAPTLANMSAPPRSTVTLPRLASSAAAPDATSGDPEGAVAQALGTLRQVPLGPGGGKLLSNALCVADVELARAVCAYLRMPFAAPLMTAHLGLARALVAIVRQSSKTRGSRNPGRVARRELEHVGALSEGTLVQELAARLESTEWPEWVPRVAFVMPLGIDIAAGIDRKSAPDAPEGVSCPLLAARLASAIRGPVFMRDAAPALSNLLNLRGGASCTWKIWLPVLPGRVRP